MKRAVALALGAALFVSGCGPAARLGRHVNRWVPALSNVTKATLNLKAPPTVTQTPIPLSDSTATGKETIAKLLGWLRKAQPLKIPPSPAPANGDHVLTLDLSDGSNITVSMFYIANAEGRYHTSSQDVKISLPDGSLSEPFRAPSLARWLKSGWREDMPLVSTSPPQVLAPPSSPGGTLNPDLQRGGVSAATSWIEQRGRSVSKIYTLSNGELILTNQTGWAIYVDTRRNVFEGIPLPLADLSFERQTADGAFLFLIRGPVGDGDDFPFPYQILCTLHPDEADLFTTQQGPMYYPLTQGISFGSKPDEVVTSVYAAGNDLRFGFGPSAGEAGEFWADFTTVPPAQVTYDTNTGDLTILFHGTELGQALDLSEARTSEIEKVSLAQTSQGVSAVLTLAPGASYYTGEITYDQKRMPYLQFDVIAGSPPALWAP